MGYIANPLLEQNLQKKQDISITLLNESGELVDIRDVVVDLENKISNKQDVSFGLGAGNKLLITDQNGKITTIEGVVMNQAERDKLQKLTNTMLLKGVKTSEEEVRAVQDPQLGWVYFVPSASGYVQYCYCETGWEQVGTTASQGVFTARKDNTVVTVGGIKAGTNLYGKSYDEILESMMFPYVAPSGFSISVAPSTITGVLETGTNVVISGVTPKVTQGSKAITSFKVYKDSAHKNLLGEATSAKAITGLSLAQKSIYATISDGSTTLSASWSATLVDPYFYGILQSTALPTTAQVTKLTKQLAVKGNKTYTYTANDQYCAFAYPKSYGAIKSILDSNGYEYLSDFKAYNLDVVFSNRTVAYTVYVQQKAATITNFAFTFKY